MKTRSKKPWLIIGAVVLAGILALVVFMFLQGEPVAAIQVKREDAIATLTVTGEVQGDTTVAFSPPVSARINAIHVDEGDAIHPGQLLVQLDTDQVEAQVREAQARAAQAQASLANVRQGTRPETIRLWEERYREAGQRITQAQSSLTAAQSRAQEAASSARRMEALYRDHVATAQEYERAQTEAEVTRRETERLRTEVAATRTQRAQIAAQLSEARQGPTNPEIREAAAARQAAEANVRAAREQLEDYRIYSSTAGIVTERLQDPGELAVPGQPILRAVNPATLEILCSVEENDLPKIRVGDTAYTILDALPDRALESRVKRIGSRVNPQSGTVDVRVVLTSQAYGKLSGVTLMPGMTADVNVVTERLHDAVVLPATAVRSIGGQWMVYVFEGNRILRKPIRAERISVENFRVISGLQPGDWVAATAGDNLLKKRRVRPVPPESLPTPAKPPSGGMAAP